MTSQTEYSPGGGAKEQNQRGRGSAFARRGFSFYIVSYSSRLRRDCTQKCRLANVLLEVGGGFPALLFTSGPTWAGLEHSAGNRRLSAVKCMSSSRSTAKGRLVALSMAARVGGGESSAVQSMRRQFIRQCRRESYSRTGQTRFDPNHTVCRLTAGNLPRSICNVLAATAHSSLLAHGTEKGGNDGRSCLQDR